MTESLPLASSVDDIIRDRAIRLFTYLKELTELRSDVKRSCDEYEQVIWWAEIPKEKECYCSFWDLGREGAYEDWIRVERPRRKKPPVPPSTLAPWLNEREVADAALEAPPLKGSIVEEIRSIEQDGNEQETVTRRLEDYPAISRQWELYIENNWWAWALEDRRLLTVQSIYNDLFAAYQTQERLGEAFEVVVGMGLLSWKPPHGPEVRRHVVTGQVTIEFDPKTGVITLAPASDGTRLALEQDMLEPQDRPLPEIQNGIQQELTELGDEVWSSGALATALNGYFQQLTSSNSLDLAIEPTDGHSDRSQPLMNFAPALLVRKRTERSLVRVFDEIADQLRNGASVPLGVEKLVAIRDDRSSDPNSESGGSDSAASELYFPLQANEAQREIARKLETRQGVLVQGPPGTGKSHTIANLICHLLATGKRLLVTSHTARALRVLKGYFPEDISPLCVSLLGDDTVALRELEESVQGILSRLNVWEPVTGAARIRELECDLDSARRDLASAYASLKQDRQNETHNVDLGFGFYQGTPQTLAQQLALEAVQFDWITLAAISDAPPPITNAEIRELLTLVREFDKETDETHKKLLPELASLLDPRQFDEQVLKERELSVKAASVDQHQQSATQSLAAVEAEARRGLEQALHDLAASLESLFRQGDEWTEEAIKQVIYGKHRAWQELHTITTKTISVITDRIERVSLFKVSGIDNRDRAIVRADAEVLRVHLAAGKGTGVLVRYSPFAPKRVRAALYLADEVRVNGRLCDSPTVLSDLLDFIEVSDSIDYLDQHWSAHAAKQSRPLALTISEYHRRTEVLQEILSLRQKIDTASAALKEFPGITVPAWHSRQELASLLACVALADTEAELHEVRNVIAHLITQLAQLRRDPNANPIVLDLVTAIEYRDLDRYSRTYDLVVKAWDLRSRFQRRCSLETKLSSPGLLLQLHQSSSDAQWDQQIEHFEEAWNWARANLWLKRLSDSLNQNALLQKIDFSQQRIRRNLQELAACKAWEYVLARLNHEQREHLMAWKLAIKKIGKGTGKYATQYRREARYHLDHCRAAIPAWVMPIYRVAETTRPEPNLFDVAIIDEASQSGPEALFLQYIARKIVVVGDDQQISPESVGLDRESVDSLRQRYIKDIPMWDALGVDNSFFDQAQIRFSGRVRLREHFRCMPEIIQFSNNLCYQAEPLIPLRQYGANRLPPVVTRHIPDGYVKGTGDRIVNRPEAEAIVEQIEKCLKDPAYDGKRFGVIGLQGNAQWNLIRDLLMERIGAQKMQQRGISGGNAYAFQGDERDVMFLSMVAAANDGRRIGVLSKDSDKRRFNVAASRARDQMWLFHSVAVDDLSTHCFRRKFLEYCLNPTVRQETVEGIEISQLRRQATEAGRKDSPAPIPFDSWFEVDVFLRIVDCGFRVIPQYPLAGKRIDLVVEGMQGRLAVECDGDQWHGIEEWERDVDRQRMLERCGLKFWRVRGSAFYRDQTASLAPLWEVLKERGIYANGLPSQATTTEQPSSGVPASDSSRNSEDEEDDFNGVDSEIDSLNSGADEDEIVGNGEISLFEESENCDLLINLAAYKPWMPHPMADPHSASLQELMEGLVEIVTAEGPIICRRAYLLYNRAAGNARLGSQIVSVMNRAIYRAVKLGRIQQNDEHKKGGQINQVVRLTGTSEVVVRERGTRALDEIPPLEIRTLRERLLTGDEASEDSFLIRKMASTYGVGRVTAQIRKLLLG